MAMVKKGKKYAGQERWENDVLDIRRVADKPRVGKETKIDRQPVSFDLKMLHTLLRIREYGTENDGLRSRDYDPTRVSSGGVVKPTLNAAGEWEYPVVKSQGSDTNVEGAALRGLSIKSEAQWVANEYGQIVRTESWLGHEQPDPVGKTVDECLEQLAIIARACRIFEKKLGLVLNAASAAKDTEAKKGHCAACKKEVSGIGEDRIKAGYGNRCCYSAWRRWSAQQDNDGVDQSHVVFQKLRLAEIDAEALEAAV